MIIEKILENNTLIQHYSDQGLKLRQVQTGIIYDEPIDIYPCPYTYEETEDYIDPSTRETTVVLEGKIEELKGELLDTQEALCDIYEMLGEV